MAMAVEDKSECIRAVERQYPGCAVDEFHEQGGCSYTLRVSCSIDISEDLKTTGHDQHDRSSQNSYCAPFIVQIRPEQHALDLRIAQKARDLYPTLAPDIRSLELRLPDRLHAYEMEMMHGTRLNRLLHNTRIADSISYKKHANLVKSFAAIIAQGWRSQSWSNGQQRICRADSPMEDTPRMLSQCKGKVGSSILSRLEKLSEHLSDRDLRRTAKNTLERILTMNKYPVVLNHGDLIPSNILVDEDTWEMTGLVDWAEAEYLPFGTCLYGLELLLGDLTAAPTVSDLPGESHKATSFRYSEHAASLRSIFWEHMFEMIPEAEAAAKDLRTMRDLGVLLWYGYAWDNGAINRVVNEIDDPVEMVCLRAFLDAA